MINPAVYYMQPAALSIQTGANGNANDLAVAMIAGAKMRVYVSPEDFQNNASLDYVDGEFQQWTVTAKNKRLATDAAYHIYARLSKSDRTGYIVFSTNEYILSPATTTIPGGLPAAQVENGRQDYWWVHIGEVSAVADESRSVSLNTGILGTTQWNNEWEEITGEVPTRVEVTNSRTGNADTPYMEHGEALTLTAKVVKRWVTDISSEVTRWSIVRHTGDQAADDVWNVSNKAAAFATPDAEGHSSITLSFTDVDNDLGDNTVDPVFTITAYHTVNNVEEVLASVNTVVYKDAPEKREWIYYQKNDSTTPTGYDSKTGTIGGDPTKPISGRTAAGVYYADITEGFVPTGWTAEMQGVDVEKKWEFGSYRDKRRKATTWGAFSIPVMMSHYGERGVDGDGVEYAFARSVSDTPPRILASDTYTEGGVQMDYTKDDYRPPVSGAKTMSGGSVVNNTRTTDNPAGVTSKLPYEWVVKRTKGAPVNGVRTWNEYARGAMSLWAKWSADGATPDYRYQWGANASQAPTYSADADNPGNDWSTTPPDRTQDGTYLWMIRAMKQSDGTYIADGVGGHIWGDPVRLTGDTGTPGEDAKEREWIYRKNSQAGSESKTGTIGGDPTKPISGQTEGGVYYADITDDFVPTNWTDHPTGVSAAGDTEYATWRDYDKENDIWGDFHVPIIWSHYGERGMDGDGMEYVFIRSKVNTAPLVYDSDEADSNGCYFDEDGYLPAVYIPNCNQGELEQNAIEESEHPAYTTYSDECGECTDEPKGVTAEYPYEWALKRTKGSPTGGVREWELYSGQMSLWAKWSEDGAPAEVYSIDLSPEQLVIPANASTLQTTLSGQFWKKTGSAAQVAFAGRCKVVMNNGGTRTVVYTSTTNESSFANVSVTAAAGRVVEVYLWKDAASVPAEGFDGYLVKREIPILKSGNDGITYRAKWELKVGNNWVEQQTLPALYTGSVASKTNATALRVTLMQRVGSGAETEATTCNSTSIVVGSQTITAQSYTISFDSSGVIWLEFNSNTVKDVRATFSKSGQTLVFKIPKVLDGQSITGATGRIPIPYGEYNPHSRYVRTTDIVPYVYTTFADAAGEDPKRHYYLLNVDVWVENQSGYDKDTALPSASWETITNFPYLFTEVLMAEMGTIGAWVFWGDYMFSAQGQGDVGKPVQANTPDDPEPGTFVPNLLLDAKTGKIASRTGFFGGFQKSEPVVVHDHNILRNTRDVFDWYEANLDPISGAESHWYEVSANTAINLSMKVWELDLDTLGSSLILYETPVPNTDNHPSGYGDIFDPWHDLHLHDNKYYENAALRVHLPFVYPKDTAHSGLSGVKDFLYAMEALLGDSEGNKNYPAAEQEMLRAESYVGNTFELRNYSRQRTIYIFGLFTPSGSGVVASPWTAYPLNPGEVIRAKCVHSIQSVGEQHTSLDPNYTYWQIESLIDHLDLYTPETFNYLGVRDVTPLP